MKWGGRPRSGFYRLPMKWGGGPRSGGGAARLGATPSTPSPPSPAREKARGGGDSFRRNLPRAWPSPASPARGGRPGCRTDPSPSDRCSAQRNPYDRTGGHRTGDPSHRPAGDLMGIVMRGIDPAGLCLRVDPPVDLRNRQLRRAGAKQQSASPTTASRFKTPINRPRCVFSSATSRIPRPPSGGCRWCGRNPLSWPPCRSRSPGPA